MRSWAGNVGMIWYRKQDSWTDLGPLMDLLSTGHPFIYCLLAKWVVNYIYRKLTLKS